MLNIRDQVLKKGEIIPLKYDFVFTSIFNDKNNMDIIEGFISSYLGIEVEKIRGKIKILGKDLPIDNKKEASNKVDLVLEYENKIINIEISNEMTKGIVERNIAYISKIHGRNVKYRMRDYNKIKNSLQINLDNNSIKFLIGEKFIDKYYLMNEEGKKLTEKIEIDYINMEKSNEISYNEKEEEIKRWCRVLLSIQSCV